VPMITALILSKNSAKTIHQTLRSLSGFQEVLVIDTGSIDETKEIAKSFSNVTLLEHDFTSFGDVRNWGSEKASHDWILQIDSDEVLTKEAFDEIHNIDLDPTCAYSFPFHNYFNGKWIRWCGWYPDRHVRLFNRKTTCFSSALVHEGVITDSLTVIPFTYPIEHFSYHRIEDFVQKMQMYSTLFAEENRYKRSSSIPVALGHSLYAFFKAYVLQRGFLGGREGFIISYYNAVTTFYKYLKLWEANRQR